MEVLDVKNRSLILFHPANNALQELNGCIAPVTKLSGPGMGLMSRKAFTKLKNLVYKALDDDESVELIVSRSLLRGKDNSGMTIGIDKKEKK